jgi:hypothetical protein
MKIRTLPLVWASIILLVAASGPVPAGGPFLVTGDGRPYRYDSSRPVRYVVDAGPFGSRTHGQAVAMVEQAFRLWASVPTARLSIEAVGELPRDIDGRSVLQFLNDLKPTDPGPVLLDSDGSILSELFGEKAGLELQGFGQPLVGDAQRGEILTSFAVLNSVALAEATDAHALQWFVHELGDITQTSAVAHWWLSGESPAVINLQPPPSRDRLYPLRARAHPARPRRDLRPPHARQYLRLRAARFADPPHFPHRRPAAGSERRAPDRHERKHP